MIIELEQQILVVVLEQTKIDAESHARLLELAEWSSSLIAAAPTNYPCIFYLIKKTLTMGLDFIVHIQITYSKLNKID